MGEVKSYKDLDVWKRTLELIEMVYRVTKAFPREEIYGLTAQMRRAAVSIASNIAEGSSKRSTAEYMRFVSIASGSAAEVEAQAIIAERLGFLNSTQKAELLSLITQIAKMLYRLHDALGEKRAA